jgi:hypothetical protein
MIAVHLTAYVVRKEGPVPSASLRTVKMQRAV